MEVGRDNPDLRASPETVRAGIEGQGAALEELRAEVALLREQNRRLEHLLRELRRALYGRRSEKFSADERQLAFEDIEGAVSEAPPLAHTRRSRAHSLTASATTIHQKGNGSSRLPDCSVIPGIPATEHCDQLPWGFHDRLRETTAVAPPHLATACEDEPDLVDRAMTACLGDRAR